MCLIQYAVCVALVLVIIMFMRASEYFTSDSYTLQTDINNIYESGGNYTDYQTVGEIPLDPWHFIKLLKLARSGTLTQDNISIIMNH